MTRAEASAGTGYAANPLDRRADLRAHPERLAALQADGAARALVFAGERAVLKPGMPLDPLFTLAEAAALGGDVFAFLGTENGAPRFAGPTGRDDEALRAGGLVVLDLRSIATQEAVPPEALAVLGQAKGLLTWHRANPRCSRCGTPTEPSCGGWRRDCPQCHAQHFQRTDPVVIMLVHRGDRCLLARKPQFVDGMVSCLAGFLEPGETIEDAVRRETLEESGIRVGAVRYHASQPWPIPHAQLMIGCLAEALDEAITLDAEELESGRWFTREECRGLLDRTHPDGMHCPPPTAIAHTLIRAWVEGAG